MFTAGPHYYFILNLHTEHKDKRAQSSAYYCFLLPSPGFLHRAQFGKSISFEALCIGLTKGIAQTGVCLFDGILILTVQFFTEYPIQSLSTLVTVKMKIL